LHPTQLLAKSIHSRRSLDESEQPHALHVSNAANTSVAFHKPNRSPDERIKQAGTGCLSGSTFESPMMALSCDQI